MLSDWDHFNCTNEVKNYWLDSVFIAGAASCVVRGQGRVSFTPSPVDRRLSESDDGQIPAWKSANQELAAVLLNLRRLEHHLHRRMSMSFPSSPLFFLVVI